MHLRRFLTLLIVTALIVTARAELSFGLDRTELTTDLVPGGQRTLRFNVNNAGTEPLPFTVYAEDFSIADGAPVFDQIAGARALAARLTVFPASFDLAPGESREVVVTLEPGAGPFTAGSYYAAVFVQSSRLTEATAGAGERGSRINVVRRLGLYVVADHQPESKPLPADVAITAITRTATGVAVKVRNPSAYVRQVNNGSVQITSVSGGNPLTLALRGFRLLPGTDTTVEVPVRDNLNTGPANVLAVVDYGAEELLTGEQRLNF